MAVGILDEVIIRMIDPEQFTDTLTYDAESHMEFKYLLKNLVRAKLRAEAGCLQSLFVELNEGTAPSVTDISLMRKLTYMSLPAITQHTALPK